MGGSPGSVNLPILYIANFAPAQAPALPIQTLSHSTKSQSDMTSLRFGHSALCRNFATSLVARHPRGSEWIPTAGSLIPLTSLVVLGKRPLGYPFRILPAPSASVLGGRGRMLVYIGRKVIPRNRRDCKLNKAHDTPFSRSQS